MSEHSPVIVERDGAVARIVLNRPDSGNSIDTPLASALLNAAITCRTDDSIRCVVLTGAGRLFCAGGDIGCFAEADDVSSLLRELTTYLHSAMSHLARMKKPLINVINGPAAGAGLGLAVMGDIVLVSPRAHFSLAYPAVGLAPDGGTSWLLPRLMGLRRFQEFALTGQRLSAEQAVALNLATRMVDDDKLAEESAVLARQLAASATGSLGQIRTLALSSFCSTFEQQMETESLGMIEAGKSPEAREGIAAFLEKRKPQF